MLFANFRNNRRINLVFEDWDGVPFRNQYELCWKIKAERDGQFVSNEHETSTIH